MLARAAERFGFSGTGKRVDGYIGPGTAANIAASLGIVPDTQGNVFLSEVEFTTPSKMVRRWSPLLDLVGSFSTREQSAGRRVLEELLAQHRVTQL